MDRHRNALLLLAAADNLGGMAGTKIHSARKVESGQTLQQAGFAGRLVTDGYNLVGAAEISKVSINWVKNIQIRTWGRGTWDETPSSRSLSTLSRRILFPRPSPVSRTVLTMLAVEMLVASRWLRMWFDGRGCRRERIF
jgi:hypothetical protein